MDVSSVSSNGDWRADNGRRRLLSSGNQLETFKSNEIVLTVATAARCIAKEILRGLIIVDIEPATPHGDFALGTFLEGVELLLILWGVSISNERSTRAGENERSTSLDGKHPSPNTQCSISSRYRRNLLWRGPSARRTSFFVSCTYGTQAGCGRHSCESFAASRPVGMSATANGGKFCGPLGGRRDVFVRSLGSRERYVIVHREGRRMWWAEMTGRVL